MNCTNNQCVSTINPCSACTSGYNCINGACVPNNICQSNLHCVAPQTCVNGYCSYYGNSITDMCYNVICPRGSTCVNGICVINGS
jgi:hypothetical protein